MKTEASEISRRDHSIDTTLIIGVCTLTLMLPVVDKISYYFGMNMNRNIILIGIGILYKYE